MLHRITINKSTLFILLAFLLGIFYRTIVGLQGVDQTDLGFCNTFYQAILQRPDANVFNFIYYLTGIMGAGWEWLFGGYGILGFRLFEALTLSAAIFLLYATFRRAMSVGMAVLAILMSFLFPTIVITFHYDTLTYMLVAASAFCLAKSVVSGRNVWLVLMGFCVGLSFFARIVNLSMLAVLLVPFAFWFLCERSEVWSKSVLLFLGVLLGCAAVFAAMALFGHFCYFRDGFFEAFSIFGDSTGNHSKGELIWRYLISYKNLLVQLPVVLSFVWLLLRFNPRSTAGNALKWSLSFASFAVLSYTSLPYLTLLAVCLVGIVYGLKRRDGKSVNELVPLYLLAAALVLPLGSDIGVQGLFNWYAGMLVFPAFSLCQGKVNKKLFLCIYFSIAVTTLLKTGFNSPYGDCGSRKMATVQIKDERLNVFTDKEKADNIGRAIKAINTFATGNRLLLLANQYSELYYATRTMPFLGQTIPTAYAGTVLQHRLAERTAHFGEYPMVGFIKELGDDDGKNVANDIRRWMIDRGYEKVYADNFIELYTTNIIPDR